jgi:hypothetical protein
MGFTRSRSGRSSARTSRSRSFGGCCGCGRPDLRSSRTCRPPVANPGISVGIYEDDGTVVEGEFVLHAGFVIGDQEVIDSDTVRIVTLAPREVAPAVCRGRDDGIMAAWEALAHWIDDSGYRLIGECRELYHEWRDGDHSPTLWSSNSPSLAEAKAPPRCGSFVAARCCAEVDQERHTDRHVSPPGRARVRGTSNSFGVAPAYRVPSVEGTEGARSTRENGWADCGARTCGRSGRRRKIRAIVLWPAHPLGGC